MKAKNRFMRALPVAALILAGLGLLAVGSCSVLNIFPTLPAMDTGGAHFSPNPNDKTAPGQVSNLKEARDANSVLLYWVNPPDQDYAGARITWTPTNGMGQPLTVSAPADSTKKLNGFDSGTTFNFTIVTMDLSGNSATGSGIRH